MSREALIAEVVRRSAGRTTVNVTVYVARVLDGDPFVYERALREDPMIVGVILGLATGRLERPAGPSVSAVIRDGQATDKPNSGT